MIAGRAKLISMLCLAMIGTTLLRPAVLHADSNLDCIADATGRKIRWNSIWEKDRSDNNTEYRISNITQFDKIPLRRITLELTADGGANIRSRTVVITTEDKARALCDRLVVEKDQLRFPGMETAVLDQLPFIRFTKDGWMRDDPPARGLGQDELEICLVGTMKFSCPASDRQRFGAALHAVEEQLRAQVP